MNGILISPDLQPGAYPTNPKAGYRISGGQIYGRISDQILCLKFNCLLKYEMNKENRFHETGSLTLTVALFVFKYR
jgi:hypothetical protein